MKSRRTSMVLCLLMLLVIVNSKQKRDCMTTSECRSEDYYCDSDKKKCFHNDLSIENNMDLIGLLLVGFVSMISNAAGYGGGSLLICLFLVVFGFQPYDAIPLSKATILAGTFINYLLIAKKRHPLYDKALIDYTVCSLLIPMLLLGTVYGVILNIMIPSIILLIILTIFFVFNTFDMLKRATKIYKEESEMFKLFQGNSFEDEITEKKPSELTNDELQIENKILDKQHYQNLDINIKQQQQGSEDQIVKEFENDYTSNFPMKKLKIIILSFLYITLLQFLRGGEGFESIIGLQRCSISSWILIFTALPFLVIIFFMSKNLLAKQEFYLKQSTRFGNQKHFLIAGNELKSTTRYSITALIGGISSGMLGIGGGPIMVPLLLDMGLSPEATSATSAFTVFMTASSTSFQYFTNGDYKIADTLKLLIASVIGSLIGNVIISTIIKKYKRSSILLIILTIASGISTFILPSFGIYKLLNSSSESQNLLGFNSPC